MEEVIALAGEPITKTENQLIYQYDRERKITPVWEYILLYGLAGPYAGPDPDLSYVNREHFCLTLDFRDNVLISHKLTARERAETCAPTELATSQETIDDVDGSDMR